VLSPPAVIGYVPSSWTLVMSRDRSRPRITTRIWRAS
jgi:hypothetical protein